MRKLLTALLALLMLCTAASAWAYECETLSNVNPPLGTKREIIPWNDDWDWAEYSLTHAPYYVKYFAGENRKDLTVFLNPGHGNGSDLSVKVLSDPLGKAYNQYSDAAGETPGHTAGKNVKYNGGTVTEAQWNLAVCQRIRNILLKDGYDVILCRERNENLIDNPGRSIVANNTSDLHVSVHFNSGTSGAFYIVPNNPKQANVSKWIGEAKRLGSLIAQYQHEACPKIAKHGPISMSMTGYNYSVIPCVYFENFGADKAAYIDYGVKHTDDFARGIADGIEAYCEEKAAEASAEEAPDEEPKE